MQRTLTALALLGLTTTAAVAEGPEGIILNQIATGDQIGTNIAVVQGSSDILNGDAAPDIEGYSELFDEFVTAGEGSGVGLPPVISADQVDQSVLNAVNILLSSGTVVSQANQTFLGEQRAINIMEASEEGGSLAVSQTGENLANIIIVEQVDNVRQAFGPGAIQQVINEISGGTGSLRGISQIGRNTANIVIADVSIGSGEQLFPDETSQEIENTVNLDQAGSMPGRIVQSGTNIGNVLVADEVYNVARVFSGDQIVRNTVNAADGRTPYGVSQSGLNIANFVSANVANGLTQVSDGRQIVENNLEGVTLADLENGVPGYTHSSTNIVNLLDIRNDRSSRSGDPIVATQRADQEQRVQASDGIHTQVGNAATIER